MTSFGCLSHQLWLGFLIVFAFYSSNVHSFHSTIIRPTLIQLHDSSSGDDVTAANSEDDSAKISTQSITTMDDGGSDLTDRFKYKVSLLGTTHTCLFSFCMQTLNTLDFID